MEEKVNFKGIHAIFGTYCCGSSWERDECQLSQRQTIRFRTNGEAVTEVLEVVTEADVNVGHYLQSQIKL